MIKYLKKLDFGFLAYLLLHCLLGAATLALIVAIAFC
jgi:hypothetical protein